MIKENSRVTGILLGIGVGIALAVALDNIAVGIGVGFVFVAGSIARTMGIKAEDEEEK